MIMCKNISAQVATVSFVKMPTVNAFFQAVAAEADVSQADVQKVLRAVNEVMVENVKKNGSCKIPNLFVVKVKKRPKREAGTRKAFGRSVEVKARPESSCVKVHPAKQLSDHILH